jgi:hypothetical protein
MIESSKNHSITGGYTMELHARIYTRTSDNGTHYARIIVPKELRPFLLKPALWRSLATTDEKEARAAGILVAVGTRQVLQDVADAYVESAQVAVAVEIANQPLDLTLENETLDPEDLELIIVSLRHSFGLGTDGDNTADRVATGTRKRAAAKRKASKGGKKTKRVEQVSVADESSAA